MFQLAQVAQMQELMPAQAALLNLDRLLQMVAELECMHNALSQIMALEKALVVLAVVEQQCRQIILLVVMQELAIQFRETLEDLS
jgi:hypothetical protein